jgi:hypothetical protein
MLPDLASVVAQSDVIVIGNKSTEFLDITERIRADQTIIDLVRLFESAPSVGLYTGIGW